MTRVIVSQQGPQGETGPANSLAIGAVTTGAAGSSASAAITGTPPTQTLALTIPRGNTGATGPTGPVPVLSVGTVGTGAADVTRRGPDTDPVFDFVLPAVGNGSITPIALAGGYVEKTASYTLTDNDYEVNYTAGPYTATLPSATGRAGRTFRVRNSTTSTITVSGASTTIPAKGYVDVRSNGTTWDVIEGAYSSASVGLASYRWNAAAGTWRLLSYDTGWRSITEIDTSGNVTGDALTASWQVMAATAGWVRVRRHNGTVYLAARFIQVTTTTPTTGLWTPTTGFSADIGGYVPLPFLTGTGDLYHSVASSTVQGTVSTTGAYVNSHISWVAPDALPPSLPGTTYSSPV